MADVVLEAVFELDFQATGERGCRFTAFLVRNSLSAARLAKSMDTRVCALGMLQDGNRGAAVVRGFLD